MPNNNTLENILADRRRKQVGEVVAKLTALVGVPVQLQIVPPAPPFALERYTLTFAEPVLGSTLFLLNVSFLEVLSAWQGFHFATCVAKANPPACPVCTALNAVHDLRHQPAGIVRAMQSKQAEVF